MQVLFRDYSFIRLSNLKRDKSNGYFVVCGEGGIGKLYYSFTTVLSFWLMTSRLLTVVRLIFIRVRDSSMASLMFTKRPSSLMVFLGCAVDLVSHVFHGLSVGLHDALKPLFDRRSGSKVCM
ncbi:hypothetical protein TIFTF001_022962 [Ficus carica]|uniref:Uncharacterized protein n=1 Tax=Ficus carica TaxID=3494 RepID=A0AA88DFX8_FICCA|nr:hypothetical protein TIFTF001_022962 [Ficus carica]